MLVAFSGGKDSTAMALRLHELGEPFRLLFTATGNELPDVYAHIADVQRVTGAEMINISAPTLEGLIEEQHCLPSFRMRWCTRMIKIEPCAAYLRANPDTLCVGLRADEEDRVGGTYDAGDIRYPLREWNWGLDEVLRCCETHGLVPPARTDCAWCYDQSLYEWWSLWKDHSALYQRGVDWETAIGHTFRSAKRDTQPTSMAGLRAKFETGYKPKQRARKRACRVCSM